MHAALSASDFRRACAQFATGVAVATALDESGGPHGLTVNSFTSVSLSPPLVLICIDYRAAIYPHFAAASHVGINVLAASQVEISNRFAMRPDDRFDGVDWKPGVTGAPLLAGALAAIECSVSKIIDAGDHAIFLMEAMAADAPSGSPLLYFASGYRQIE